MRTGVRVHPLHTCTTDQRGKISDIPKSCSIFGSWQVVSQDLDDRDERVTLSMVLIEQFPWRLL